MLVHKTRLLPSLRSEINYETVTMRTYTYTHSTQYCIMSVGICLDHSSLSSSKTSIWCFVLVRLARSSGRHPTHAQSRFIIFPNRHSDGSHPSLQLSLISVQGSRSGFHAAPVPLTDRIEDRDANGVSVIYSLRTSHNTRRFIEHAHPTFKLE